MRISKKASKQKQVLEVIQKYGPISTSTLYKILGEQTSKRYLRHVARKLQADQLLVNATLNIKGQPSPYYYLSRKNKSKQEIARILGIRVGEVGSSTARYSNLAHEDMLAQIQFEIESQFPDVILIRDWQLTKSCVPPLVFSRRLMEEFCPDIIVGLPVTYSNAKGLRKSHRWVAVELERHRKKHSRVKTKLRDYAERTGLDGVLYMLPERSLEKQYQAYFKEKATLKALQMKGYKNCFFATTHLPKEGFSVFSHHLNFSNGRTSIYNWFDFLKNTDKRNRSTSWLKFSSQAEILA